MSATRFAGKKPSPYKMRAWEGGSVDGRRKWKKYHRVACKRLSAAVGEKFENPPTKRHSPGETACRYVGGFIDSRVYLLHLLCVPPIS